MPDVCGFWDRRADDPGYESTTLRGLTIYRYNGRLVTYQEREKLRAEAKAKRKKRNQITNKKNLQEIILVDWEESERGWGTRPDGCSLHINSKDYAQYIKNYWARMPKEVPDEYSRPSSNPVDAYVTQKLYERIKGSKNGIMIYETEMIKLKETKELILEVTR